MAGEFQEEDQGALDGNDSSPLLSLTRGHTINTAHSASSSLSSIQLGQQTSGNDPSPRQHSTQNPLHSSYLQALPSSVGQSHAMMHPHIISPHLPMHSSIHPPLQSSLNTQPIHHPHHTLHTHSIAHGILPHLHSQLHSSLNPHAHMPSHHMPLSHSMYIPPLTQHTANPEQTLDGLHSSIGLLSNQGLGQTYKADSSSIGVSGQTNPQPQESAFGFEGRSNPDSNSIPDQSLNQDFSQTQQTLLQTTGRVSSTFPSSNGAGSLLANMNSTNMANPSLISNTSMSHLFTGLNPNISGTFPMGQPLVPSIVKPTGSNSNPNTNSNPNSNSNSTSNSLTHLHMNANTATNSIANSNPVANIHTSAGQSLHPLNIYPTLNLFQQTIPLPGNGALNIATFTSAASLPSLNPVASSGNNPSSRNASSSSSHSHQSSTADIPAHPFPSASQNPTTMNSSILNIIDPTSTGNGGALSLLDPAPSQTSTLPFSHISASGLSLNPTTNSLQTAAIPVNPVNSTLQNKKRQKRTARAACLADNKSDQTSDGVSNEVDWNSASLSSLPPSISTGSSKDKTEFPVDEKGNLCVEPQEIISGRYMVESILGEGTFSRVLKAYDLLERNFVALKIIKKQYTRNSTHESAQLQLLNENDPHDRNGIVRLKGQFYCNIQHCMVLELGSCTLLDVIKSHGKLSIEQVALYGRQILRSLTYISNFNIIHCDLKPENILVFLDSSTLKLSDFGSSCIERRYIAGSYIQSRYYRAPEILLELAHDRSIDMWSCGCIFMEMVTGKPLFAGTSVLDQMCKISEVCGLPPDYMIKDSLVLSKFFFDDRGRYRLKKASPLLPPGTIEFSNIDTLSGTRWIIKESKTHPGSFYYVNTITGASQWERPIIRPLDELVKQAYPTLEDVARDALLDLVRRMLSYDQLTRINPEEAHNHAFFNHFPTYNQSSMMKRRKSSGAS